MSNDLVGSSERNRLRPVVRKVALAVLATVALTLAYPTSARKAARTNESGHPAMTASVTGDRAKQVREADPQLSFSMRTVVRPAVDTSSAPDSTRPVAKAAVDAAPKFEGYLAPTTTP
jgi:hypothetical protein